ncbi:collagen alpha-2(I) chain [Mycetomoellerius zeteki]|uniref:collagen alpha-2(I) chain n=1 Tax=Mycetomoellerius zeteki TaxID=64791 RepID=UPI00084E4F0D|nr:PREDICTED: collagen alpha-2(I) chain-like [Trachymyrmex zeteki]
MALYLSREAAVLLACRAMGTSVSIATDVDRIAVPEEDEGGTGCLRVGEDFTPCGVTGRVVPGLSGAAGSTWDVSRHPVSLVGQSGDPHVLGFLAEISATLTGLDSRLARLEGQPQEPVRGLSGAGRGVSVSSRAGSARGRAVSKGSSRAASLSAAARRAAREGAALESGSVPASRRPSRGPGSGRGRAEELRKRKKTGKKKGRGGTSVAGGGGPRGGAGPPGAGGSSSGPGGEDPSAPEAISGPSRGEDTAPWTEVLE